MTVYVDNMKAQYGRMIMCHMIADTEQELHDMAQRIGVRRKWYQGNHYDICLKMKNKAIRLGAIEVTKRDLVRKLIRIRKSTQSKELSLSNSTPE